MQTPESHLAGRLFHGGEPDWKPLLGKAGDALQHDALCLALRSAQEVEVSPFVEMHEGEWKRKGLHFPHRITFMSGVECGPVTTRQAIFKAAQVHRENKRYRESMNPAVTGPEREILSYALDQALGFDLVPPTIGREIDGLGYGSVQAWVEGRTAWKWRDDYDFKTDTLNPWLHRLAAFDFIRGEIDQALEQLDHGLGAPGLGHRQRLRLPAWHRPEVVQVHRREVPQGHAGPSGGAGRDCSGDSGALGGYACACLVR